MSDVVIHERWCPITPHNCDEQREAWEARQHGPGVAGEYLSGYDEIIALLDAIPVLLREKRRRLGLTLRAAEAASGVSFNSIKRIEDGASGPAWGTVLDLLRWIGRPDHLSVPPPDDTTEATAST